MAIEINIQRVRYLMSLYKMSGDVFFDAISQGLVKPITHDDVFKNPVKKNHLKRIDKVFKKGLLFYTDPTDIKFNRESSIFFRKEAFESELNIRSIEIVNQYESKKHYIDSIMRLSGYNIERKLPIYSINDNPREVAISIKDVLEIHKYNRLKHREFLEKFINSLATQNIFVHEFIEAHSRNVKANIDGFYLHPHTIVLKRNQDALIREIYTLAHELGHYLLDKEEVEEISYESPITNTSNFSGIERWCNDFAYFLLIGDQAEQIDNLRQSAGPENDYYHDIINQISRETKLSKLALYTRLLLQNKISHDNYKLVRQDLKRQYEEYLQEKEMANKLKAETSSSPGWGRPKPILSPLLVSAFQIAYYRGVVDESRVSRELNLKGNRLNKILE